MKVKEKDNYILIKVNEGYEMNNLISNLENLIFNHYSSSNIAVDLLNYNQLTNSDLEAFLSIATRHKNNQKSFVLVNDSVEIDDIPEQLNVVPTVLEAGDVIEMEEIERDLGF